MSKAEEVLKDIKDNPDRHRHTFSDLYKCCTIDGEIDLRLLEAHGGIAGCGNGPSRCDVSKGPCACGAWH